MRALPATQPHALIECGFYDDNGDWQRLNGGTFGGDRAPFGGWGSWDRLVAGVIEKARRHPPCPEIVLNAGRLEIADHHKISGIAELLWTRFTLVDPAAFASEAGNSIPNIREVM